MTNSSGTPTIFRSSDPLALAAFDKAAERDKEWTDGLERLLAASELSVTRGRSRVFPDEVRFSGVMPEKGQNPPEGWRKDVKSGYFLPALKTATGRALAKQIGELGRNWTVRHYLSEDTGMPWLHFGEHRMFHPGCARLDGVVWVQWGCAIDAPNDRRWDAALPKLLAVMLNPSDADHLRDDHTVRKLYGFCGRWGYGGFDVANAYAYQATDPKAMHAAQRAGIDIVGPDNLNVLRELAGKADLTLVAWGASTPKDAAFHLYRVTKLLAAQSDLHCIGKTKSGAPRHPLMVGYDQPLELFQGRTP